MGWLIAFGVLLLLALIPLGVSVAYNEDGPTVRVIIGLIHFRLNLSGKKKKQKPEKPAKKKTGKKKKEPQSSAVPVNNTDSPRKKGGSFLDFLPLLKDALDFLNSFRRKLRVDCLYLRLTMASNDPCTLGINYGRAWAALGNLLPQMERVFVIRNRDIDIACDFTSSETLIDARIDITITLGRIIGLAVVYGIRVLINYLKIMKKRKGGVSK